MVKRKSISGSSNVKVTFALRDDDPRLPASVVGDFNGWNPDANPMRPRRNGTWSAVVTLQKGREVVFRYRSSTGEWFNDSSADGFRPNEFASEDCVIQT